MGILKLFSRPVVTYPILDRLPAGALAVDRAGVIVASTLPAALTKGTVEQIGRAVLHSFAASRKINTPLSELTVQLNGMKIVARELRGGALIFLHSEHPSDARLTLPTMSNSTLDDFILYLETYIECWKQFNHYVNLARTKNFTAEDETQFLEVKSLVAQGLEVILAAVEQGGPRKDEVMALINGAPSIRHLCEHENSIATVESQWHKTFLMMQSLLGRLKVQQQKQEGEWTWSSLFGKAER
jgi:hypothetical protein